MDNKDRQITRMNANNSAAAFMAAAFMSGTEWEPAVFFEIRDQIYENTIAAIEAEEGSNVIQGAFPGAVNHPAVPVPTGLPPLPPQAAFPAPQAVPGPFPAAPPAGPAPAPFPGGSGGSNYDDLMWRQLFADFQSGQQGNWYDNRNDKQSDRSPDFKRKSDKKGLWINKAPDWAKQQLGVS